MQKRKGGYYPDMEALRRRMEVLRREGAVGVVVKSGVSREVKVDSGVSYMVDSGRVGEVGGVVDSFGRSVDVGLGSEVSVRSGVVGHVVPCDNPACRRAREARERALAAVGGGVAEAAILGIADGSSSVVSPVAPPVAPSVAPPVVPPVVPPVAPPVVSPVVGGFPGAGGGVEIPGGMGGLMAMMMGGGMMGGGVSGGGSGPSMEIVRDGVTVAFAGGFPAVPGVKAPG